MYGVKAAFGMYDVKKTDFQRDFSKFFKSKGYEKPLPQACIRNHFKEAQCTFPAVQWAPAFC